MKLIIDIGGILNIYMENNYELYKIFYTTARLGSVSKAAKVLYTSQPAVSYSIKKLEELLGGPLFHRNSKGVSLTAEGKVFYKYVEEGCNSFGIAERKYRELKNLNAGQLRISVCSAICKFSLMEYLQEYNLKYPNIKILIRDESAIEMKRSLDSGDMDIGVMNIQYCNGLNLIKSITVRDCFVVGERFKHVCEQKISLYDLATNYPLLLPEKGGSTREHIDDYFKSNNVTVSCQAELSNFEVLIEFAKKGLGVSCVIKNYVVRALEKKRLYEVPVIEAIPERTLSVVTSKGTTLSTAAMRFIEILEKRMR